MTRGLGPRGELTVDLVTSDIIIDREHPEILSEGGLYQFQVILASDWSILYTCPDHRVLLGHPSPRDPRGVAL